MVKRLNTINMTKKLLYLFALIFVSIFSYAQENDDMYFNKKDRLAKKVKKITPAQTILNKYRSGITGINNSDRINSEVISKYTSRTPIKKNLSKNNDRNIKSLKYNRDNLFRSKSFSKSFLDMNIYMMYGRIRPNYYYMMDPFELSFLNFQGLNPYSNLWMPRNLYGLRMLAALDPLMFFSNPFLSSLYPMMSPSLFNIHHPGVATYGLCDWSQSYQWSQTYPKWIWTKNGTGGGLQHTPGNNHIYISNYINNDQNGKVEVKGPRGGRGGIISKDNFDGLDRYVGRRESGITNKVIQKETDGSIDKSQNAYLRGNQSGRENYISRSGRSNSILNTNRRSESLNRSYSNRINAINDAFSNNSLRSSRSSGSNYYTSDDNGRRGAYSLPNNYSGSRSGISNIGSSGRSSSGTVRSGGYSSSGYSGGSSYSGGGSSYSGSSGSSSGGGATVSAGSSGGSSRGNN